MVRFKVDSSNLMLVGYSNGTLEVVFRNGAIYHYSNVPKEVFKELLKAESKGKFLNAMVKGIYPYKLVGHMEKGE